MKRFKPMLAAKPHSSTLDDNMKLMRFPLMASPKVDGIRATVQDDLYSRSLKLIPNRDMRAAWAGLKYGLDGEIICGDPVASDVFNRTTSQVMSQNGGTEKAVYWLFDHYDLNNPYKPFSERYAEVVRLVKSLGRPNIKALKHELIKDYKALAAYEKRMIDAGFEGICTRSPDSPYKQGRSTLNEQGLVAFKRVADAEGKIVALYEQETNTNRATTNELGRTKRSSHKAGKVANGTLGGFTVRAKGWKLDFDIGTGVGLTTERRAAIWAERDKYVGRVVKFKYQDYSTKAKPRQPIFLGFRDGKDM